MAKVYAFDPPSASDAPLTRDDIRSKPRLANIGRGVYYADLGMRRMDVDKRARMQGMTGKDYLETAAMYEARRKQKKGEK